MIALRAVLALVLLLASTADLRTQAAPLRVHFIDVGQGDAILIQSPSGQNVVYDAGEDPTRVRDYLTALGITAVNLVIASHNHADHIGGLREVLRTFRPQFYMDNGVPATTQVYANLLDAVREAGSELLPPVSRRITFGDAALVVVEPARIASWDQNDNSIGIVVEYGSFRLSLMGDGEAGAWSWWLTHFRNMLTPVQVHKSSHHGSVNGDTAEGIARLAPKAVVIGVGEGNAYGHPDAQTLQMYAGASAAVYRTDVNGTVIVEAQTSGAYTVRVEKGEGAQPPPAPAPAPTPAPSPTPAPTPTPAPAPSPTPSPAPAPSPSPAPAPTPSPSPSPPATSWTGPLPPRSSGSHPVCQQSLPSTAACVNNLIGPPQALCTDRAFSCSTGSGTCSGHGGVYCWRN